MTRLTTEQWFLLIASVLTAVTVGSAGLTNWHQMTAPAVVIPILGNIAIQIRAFFTSPNPPNSATTINPKNLQ